jgi:hypothetical protein
MFLVLVSIITLTIVTAQVVVHVLPRVAVAQLQTAQVENVDIPVVPTIQTMAQDAVRMFKTEKLQ